MLLDTESALTLMDEIVYLQLREHVEKLEKTPITVQSATKHALDIIGQSEAKFKLMTRKGGIREFQQKFAIVKGLAKPIILGMDFLGECEANIKLASKKVVLCHNGTRSVHELVQGHGSEILQQARLCEQLTIPPRNDTCNMSSRRTENRKRRRRIHLHTRQISEGHDGSQRGPPNGQQNHS
jgi:hypothetical protein